MSEWKSGWLEEKSNKSYFSLYLYKHYCTQTHMVLWVGITLHSGMTNRLIMSSNTVWVRFQLMFRSLNKLMCEFGKLTLMPASFSIFSFYISTFLPLQWVSMRKVCTYNKHKITITHRDTTHESHTTSSSIKTNKTTHFFLADNSHLTGTLKNLSDCLKCASAS